MDILLEQSVTIDHIIFYNLFSYSVFTVDCRLNVTSLMSEKTEITKIEMKEVKQIAHHLHNEHKMYFGKTQYEKSLTRR